MSTQTRARRRWCGVIPKIVVLDLGSLFGALAFVGLLGGGVVAVARLIRRDADAIGDMRSVTRARLGEAREDAVVRVTARVVAAAGGELLVAPVSGAPCVAYECWLGFGRHTRIAEEPIKHDRSIVPFVVDDGSAHGRVEANVQVLVLRRRVEGEGGPDDVPPPFARWLEENHSSDEWRHARQLFWWEKRLAPGDRVSIVGVVRRQIDPDGDSGGYRDAPMTVTLADADDAPLSVSDDPSLLDEKP